MPTVKRLEPHEIDAAADLTARVFGAEGEYDSLFEIARAASLHCPFTPPELCWVVRAQDRLVARLQLLDFRVRLGSVALRIGGIQGFVAEPDENHKGYARLLAQQVLSDLEGMDFDLLLGYAQRGGFYTRIGAVPLMAEYEFEFDPQRIPSLNKDPFHEWHEEELPALIEHYNRANRTRSGSLIRTLEHWPWMLRKPPVVHMSEGGYIGVRYHGQHLLNIREIAGEGEDFHELALRKLAALARAAGIRQVRGGVPADHPLVIQSIPYGARIETQYTKRSGCMALCLAPLRMLSRLREDLDARLVASAHCDTSLLLCVRCGEESVELLLNEKGGERRHVQLELSAGAIAQLAFGYRPLRSILREQRGATQRCDDADIALIESLFPHGHPFMWQTDRY